MRDEESLTIFEFIKANWGAWRAKYNKRGVIAIGVHDRKEWGWGVIEDATLDAVDERIDREKANIHGPIPMAFLNLAFETPTFNVPEILGTAMDGDK